LHVVSAQERAVGEQAALDGGVQDLEEANRSRFAHLDPPGVDIPGDAVLRGRLVV